MFLFQKNWLFKLSTIRLALSQGGVVANRSEPNHDSWFDFQALRRRLSIGLFMHEGFGEKSV